jgi:hypothetical protein
VGKHSLKALGALIDSAIKVGILANSSQLGSIEGTEDDDDD